MNGRLGRRVLTLALAAVVGLGPAPAALAGGGFLALCDGVTNLLPQALPVGVLTHLMGGPFFLALLLKAKLRTA